MERQKKIKYLRIALNMQNIGINEQLSDQVIETYEKMLSLGDAFTLSDAAIIEQHVKDKYAEPEKK